jgi:hypothetical protein
MQFSSFPYVLHVLPLWHLIRSSNSSFVVYLTTRSAAEVIKRPVVVGLMSNGLESVFGRRRSWLHSRRYTYLSRAAFPNRIRPKNPFLLIPFIIFTNDLCQTGLLKTVVSDLEETNLDLIFFAKYLRNNQSQKADWIMHGDCCERFLAGKEHRYFNFSLRQT